MSFKFNFSDVIISSNDKLYLSLSESIPKSNSWYQLTYDSTREKFILQDELGRKSRLKLKPYVDSYYVHLFKTQFNKDQERILYQSSISIPLLILFLIPYILTLGAGFWLFFNGYMKRMEALDILNFSTPFLLGPPTILFIMNKIRKRTIKSMFINSN